MYSILLVIIYVAFISLGLPDSVLGAAWPSMQPELLVPLSYAGGISILISGGTVISSLASGRLIEKLGTGRLTALSVFMTAGALFGFSISGAYWQLCLFAIPYGLGAGSVDAALNHFVSLHYEAKHMSWLHCFWGIGATLGPYIMGLCLTAGKSWQVGYRLLSLFQILFTAVLILTLPLWKQKKEEGEEEKFPALSLAEVWKLPGAKEVMTAFFGYCSVEATAGLWAASFLVLTRGIDANTAAKWAALFYLGITAGRFVSGFLTMRLKDKSMIRLGQTGIFMGILLLVLPFGKVAAFVGLILTGFGCAPIYPSLIHATPDTFGKQAAQSVIGVQMASAYVGTTFMPPFFGLLQKVTGIGAYPLFLLLFLILMTVMSERVSLKKRESAA